MHDTKFEKFLSWAVPGPTRQLVPARVRLAAAKQKLVRMSLRLGFLVAWLSSGTLGAAAFLAVFFALILLAGGEPRDSWQVLKMPQLSSWLWAASFLSLSLCGKLWFRYRERFSDQTHEAADAIAGRISNRTGRTLSSAERAQEALRDLGELEQISLFATGNLWACWVTVYAVGIRLEELRKRLHDEIERETAQAGYDLIGWRDYANERPEK